MSVRRAALAWPFVLAGALSGCTSFISSLPGIGEPENLPKRPETTGAYPAVHDMPAPRDTKPMSEADRKKLEAELAAARDKQEAETNTMPAKPPGK